MTLVQRLLPVCSWRAHMCCVLIAWALSAGLPVAAAIATTEPTLVLEAGNHTGAIRRVAVSPDQKLLATVSDDKTTRVWQIEGGRLLLTLRWPVGAGDLGRMYGVAFSPDGQELAIGGTSGNGAAGHRLQVYSAVNGQALRSLSMDAGHVVRLLWTRSGRHLAACLSGSHGVRILDAGTGRASFADSFDAPCFGLAELPDGGLLASGYDGQIRLYRQQAGGWQLVRQARTEIPDPRSMAVSPDGRLVAVGYNSRLSGGQAVVDVLDATTLGSVQRFSFSDLHRDAAGLGSVAWSQDGNTIAAAGRATENSGSRARVVLKRIAWPSGRTLSDFAATDTVQDMAAWGAQGFLLATGHGTWGLATATGPVEPLGAAVLDLRGPDNLAIDDNGRTLSFASEGWSEPRQFSLARRELADGKAPGAESPRRFSFSLSVRDWQDQLRPVIAGREQPMEPGEVSRAVALLPDAAAAVLGTSRTLRRIARDGATDWSVRTASEVTAVHTTRDGRLIVGTLLNGTINWWRAADGQLLLSLFTSTDGRWVLWSPQGYYDASVGAESLVGWLVPRADGQAVDYYSIARFRDRYHRPDVLDRVLELLDPVQALAAADQQRQRHVNAGPLREDPLPELPLVVAALPAPAPARPPARQPVAVPTPAPTAIPAPVPTVANPRPPPASVPPIPTAPVVAIDNSDLARIKAPEPDHMLAGVAVPSLQPDPVKRILPPLLSVYNERAIQAGDSTLLVRFSIHDLGLPARTMRVRVGGRPAEPIELVMPARQDGSTVGHLRLIMPEANAEVAVMADAGTLVSEPVLLAWVWRRPPPSSSALPSRVSPPPIAGATLPSEAGRQSAALTAGSRLFVVAIGVSAYARKDYALDLPAKDATDFAALMKSQGGRMYSHVEARLLTDAAATRAAMLEALAWLRQTAGPRDTAMLFIAGHGVNDAGGRYFFLPHDADVDRLSQTAVSESHLRQSLASIRGKAVLFVDTCHAGNVVGNGAALSNEIARLANTLASAENGVIVFSSSTGRQESIEQVKWGNGAFTKALLDGLRGGADFRKEGVVTHHGLSYFLGREVSRLTKGRQTPVTAVPVGVVDYPVVALAGG